MFFEIKAYRESEGVIILSYEANDPADALLKAESQGYRVISSRAKSGRFQLPRRNRFSLILFSQELLSLLEAGLNLVEAIETLAEKEQNTDARKIYTELIRLMYEGQPFSKALEIFPHIFPVLYIATVRASEKTGDLKQALIRYLSYQAQFDIVRKKVVNAAIYPAILFIVGIFVIGFLLTYVVPRFSHVYEDMGNSQLPIMSRVLINWGNFFDSHSYTVLMVSITLFVLTGYSLTRVPVRAWLGRRLWEIPTLGARAHIYQLARLYRTAGMLLNAGIPIVTALEMALELLQKNLQANLQKVIQMVREGQPLSIAMEKNSLTTEVALRMLRVGERSGNLGEMMERAAKFYDEDMARWIEWFTRLFEPLLMVFIGFTIGVIVLLMYLPIFELAGSIQ